MAPVTSRGGGGGAVNNVVLRVLYTRPSSLLETAMRLHIFRTASVHKRMEIEAEMNATVTVVSRIPRRHLHFS